MRQLKTIAALLLLSLILIPLYSSSQNWLNSETRINLDSIYKPFYHGVASGDPLADRVILWTRVTPDTTTSDSIEVTWKIGTDVNLTQIVASGLTHTDDSKDHTVKIDVVGLNQDTWYYYSFNALGRNSITGRTKTAPNGDKDSLRLAVVSCSSYEHGYFNAYKRIADRNDIEAVLHLGDYTYEYAAGSYSNNINGRDYEPTNETVTLLDYRTRMSHYHLDSDLRDLHQQYPWITIWDDHESANDAWTDGAQNHDTTSEGSWDDRKSAAIQAYYEWLPIRQADPNDPQRIYRKFNFGNLADLYMLDTRLEGRDEQVATTSADLNDSNRTILGTEQYNWLVNNMDSSNAQWQILGQQVMFAPMLAFSQPLNTDQWDGYPIERQLLINDLLSKNIDNMIVLTGDIHTSWANDIPLHPTIPYDTSNSDGSVGVEFVTTSITSPGIDLPFNLSPSVIQTLNPYIKYVDLTQKGYILLDINKQRAQADWYYVPSVTQIETQENYAVSYYTNNHDNHLNTSSSASEAITPFPSPAPPYPIIDPAVNTDKVINEAVFFGVYPIPFSDDITLKIYCYKPIQTSLEIIDLSGRTIKQIEYGKLPKGINYPSLNMEEFTSGQYILTIKTPNQVLKRKIIKH